MLAAAGTTLAEAMEPTSWYTQDQVNRFHAAMEAAIGDPGLCRTVGRFSTEARATGLIKQVALGLLDPGSFYVRMHRVAPLLTRATAVEGRRTGPNGAEVVFRQLPGVAEQPFQCDNRLGSLEGAAMVFTGTLPEVEHPECVHRGGTCCRYRISWRATATYRWRQARSVTVLAGVALVVGAAWLLPLPWALAFAAATLALALAVSIKCTSVEARSMRRIAETQAIHARESLEELARNHALSVLQGKVAEVSSQRLRLDRFVARVRDELEGGHEFEHVEIALEGSPPVVARGASEPPAGHAALPITFGAERLGWLRLAKEGGAEVTSGDLALLERVASQIAVGVHNARSFEAIEASEKNYRDLVENAMIAILRFTPGGIVTFCNSFAQTLFGLSPECGNSCLLGTVFPDTPESGRALGELLELLQRRSDSLAVVESNDQAELVTARSIAWTFKGSRDSEGRLVEVLAIGNDISELKQAAREHERLSRQLVQAQKMEAIGTLAGGVAHDFNNLLTGILANVSLILQGGAIDPVTREALEDVDQAARSAAGLTKQLLGFARHGKYEVATLDVNELVQGTLRLFSRTSRGVTVETDLAADVSCVQADRSQLEQVLLNLYVNAAQAMPDGGDLRVETRDAVLAPGSARAALPAGAYVSIRVTDSGQGMDEATQARIFEPFFTTKARERGTGLGLASAYGIVRNHGGVLTVDSRLGEGATFEILLPAHNCASRTEDPARPASVRGVGTILVVDDEVMLLRAASRMLTRLGYKVLTASSGQAALELYAAQSAAIDLVVLDMIMPGMGGAEVFRELRRIDPNARVLLSSGFSVEEHAAAILERGALGFLPKPYDVSEVSSKIREVLLDARS